MDAYNTDVRPLLRELRARTWASTRTRWRRTGGPGTRSRSSPNGSAASRPGGAPDRDARRTSWSPAATGSAPTRATPTTPAATPRRRAPRSTRSPATPVELLWVKGSGGDLGTLTEAGLAVLRLDRLRALVDVYPGVEREDEMVAAFDFCLHGRGGAAPSIDTAMHGLVDAAHVDHLHPDAGIALRHRRRRRGADPGVLRRPGGLGAVAAARLPARAGHRRGQARPTRSAIGVILGGHGITAWGATSARVRGELAGDHPDRARRSSTRAAGRSRSDRWSPSGRRCPTTSAGSGPPRWPR